MAGPPQIVLPSYVQLPSSLWVPSSVQAVEPADLPDGVVPGAIPDLILVGQPPRWHDQVGTYITIAELGYPKQSMAAVLGLVASLPFERIIRALAHLQRQLGDSRFDLDAQKRLLDSFLPDGAFKGRVHALVDQTPNSFIFSEQALLVFQRLAIEHSLAEDRDPTSRDEAAFVQALFSIPDAYLELSDTAPATSEKEFAEQILRYFVATGGLSSNELPSSLIVRASLLYGVLAASDEAHAHNQYCPVNDWMFDEYGVDVAQFQAGGLAFAALAKLFERSEPGPVGVLPGILSKTALADREAGLASALAADRTWFADQFAQNRTQEYIARDFRPFYKRPFLRMDDDALLPLSPRAVHEALGDHGLFFRLLDLARDRGARQRFTNFNGWLYEQYALDLARSAFPPGSNAAATVQVHGEVRYKVRKQNRKSPDVALECAGLDLILIEVSSGHLTEKSLIAGDADQMQVDLTKKLTEKISQLYARIDEFLAGAFEIPNIARDSLIGLWPILVHADALFQTQFLWDHIDQAVGKRPSNPRERPLTLLEMSDYERFLGLCQTRWPVDLLARKTSPMWARRDFDAWVRNDFPRQDVDDDRALMDRHWSAVIDRIARTMWPDGPPRDT